MALEQSNNSLFIGSQHIRLKSVNSTNKYAAEYLSKSNPMEGTVISASFQYEGSGQIGRSWESEEEKNITCSTILYPTFLQAHDQFYLNMAVSLAVRDFISTFLSDKNLKVFIKWPNDIYVNDEKIAGILIQNSIRGKNLSSTIIGMGININQTEFSSEIPHPTSLKILLNSTLDLDFVIKQLFSLLTQRYDQLCGATDRYFSSIKSDYLEHLYRRNIWSNFQTENLVTISGKITGVDGIGRLTMQLKDGTIQAFAFREVKFVI